MKDSLEYKILKFLSEKNNEESVDVSDLEPNKKLLKQKLLELKKEKLIKYGNGIDLSFGDGSNLKIEFIRAKINFNGLKFLKEIESENKNITNNFNNSTIGQFNQSDELKVLKTEIKQTIHPKIKEKQQNAIISFVEKFWWLILIPLLLGIVLIAIEKKWNIIFF